MNNDRWISLTKGAWVLFAEDDPLFAQLFSRFWKKRFPEISLVQVASIAEVEDRLANAETMPSGAILDRNLKDGESAGLVDKFECPLVQWSAGGGDGFEAKPTGRVQLEEAINRIGVSLGL